MNNIIIQGEHPVFWKTCAEEIALIDGGYSDELEEYICWHGLRHKQARIHLGLSDNLKAVRLYNRMFISDWPEEVFPVWKNLASKPRVIPVMKNICRGSKTFSTTVIRDP